MAGRAKLILREIRDRGLFEKWFFNRGQGIWSDVIALITLTTVVGLFITLLNNNFHTNFDTGKAMLFVPVVMLVYWITGRIDFYILHIVQRENEITLIANPALYEKLKRMDKTIQQIKDKLGIKNEQERNSNPIK